MGDEGCYCTEEELRSMVLHLMPKASERKAEPVKVNEKMSRPELISAVFKLCDRDGDAVLNAKELRIFASQTGFEGDEKAWNEEYGKLCLEHNTDTRKGVTLPAFMSMVNDQSEA